MEKAQGAEQRGQARQIISSARLAVSLLRWVRGEVMGMGWRKEGVGLRGSERR